MKTLKDSLNYREKKNLCVYVYTQYSIYGEYICTYSLKKIHIKIAKALRLFLVTWNMTVLLLQSLLVSLASSLVRGYNFLRIFKNVEVKGQMLKTYKFSLEHLSSSDMIVLARWIIVSW